MSVNTKLTNLANEIREISGTTTKKSLDVMTSDISAANDLIDEQETLLNDLRDIVDTLPEPISGVEYHPDDNGNGGLSIDRSFNNIEFNIDNRISLTGYTTVFASGDVDSQLDLTSFNGQVSAPNLSAGNIKKDVSILGVTGTYEGSGGGASLETCTLTVTIIDPIEATIHYVNGEQSYVTGIAAMLSSTTITCLKNSIIFLDATNNSKYNGEITLIEYFAGHSAAYIYGDAEISIRM